jgi:hypothetical protein
MKGCPLGCPKMNVKITFLLYYGFKYLKIIAFGGCTSRRCCHGNKHTIPFKSCLKYHARRKVVQFLKSVPVLILYYFV